MKKVYIWSIVLSVILIFSMYDNEVVDNEKPVFNPKEFINYSTGYKDTSFVFLNEETENTNDNQIKYGKFGLGVDRQEGLIFSKFEVAYKEIYDNSSSMDVTFISKETDLYFTLEIKPHEFNVANDMFIKGNKYIVAYRYINYGIFSDDAEGIKLIIGDDDYFMTLNKGEKIFYKDRDAKNQILEYIKENAINNSKSK